MQKIIEFRDVSIGYGKKTVLSSLSFKINKGDFLAVCGSNGSGKTTLLKAIMNLMRVQKGVMERPMGQSYGYCMQRQTLDTLFPFTVYEVVMMGRTKMIGPLKFPTKVDRKKIEEVLSITGCWSLKDELFYELSGGQKQRALIARALSSEPNFLVFDEPTADLDRKMAKDILSLIKDLQKRKNLAVVIVSHEINEIINYADKFIFLSKNLPAKVFPKEQLTNELLSKVLELQVDLIYKGGKKILVS